MKKIFILSLFFVTSCVSHAQDVFSVSSTDGRDYLLATNEVIFIQKNSSGTPVIFYTERLNKIPVTESMTDLITATECRLFFSLTEGDTTLVNPEQFYFVEGVGGQTEFYYFKNRRTIKIKSSLSLSYYKTIVEDCRTSEGGGSVDTNMAEDNLTLDANRLHDLNGFDWRLKNGELGISVNNYNNQLLLHNYFNYIDFNTDYINLKRRQTVIPELRFYDYIGNNYIGFKAPETLSDTTVYVWPEGGTDGQVLSVEGDSLYWKDENYDNDRLPYIYNVVHAQGLAANESVSNYNYDDINANRYKFSTTSYGTGGEYGGWLANVGGSDSITISAPFWVVIGDSQAEGHPARHGRLHQGGGINFDYDYTDQDGQLSYHLRELTGLRWFNHGIGGQTTEEVLNRFNRDALGMIEDAGDGIGSRTLSGKPQGVVIIAGINDLYNGSLTLDDTKGNLLEMSKRCAENNIYCVMLNLPGDEINTYLQSQQVDEINDWMESGILQHYGVTVVDYNTWWQDDAYNDNFHGNDLLADDIHPTAVGYDSLAQYIYREAKLPILKEIIINTERSPDGFSGFSRPSNISIDNANYTGITQDVDTISIVNSIKSDSINIKINASTDVTGISYHGFSHIEYILSNDYAGETVTKRENTYTPSFSSLLEVDTSFFKKSGNTIYPKSSLENLSIGANSSEAKLVIDSRDGTTSNTLKILNEDGSNQLIATDNNRFSIGHWSTPSPYPLAVKGGLYVQSETTSDYFYSTGASLEFWGATKNPVMNFKGNYGGVRHDFRLLYALGSGNFYFEPYGVNGFDGHYYFQNTSDVNILDIDMEYEDVIVNGRFVVNNTAEIDTVISRNILLKENPANGISTTTIKAEDVTASYTIETPPHAGGVDNIMTVSNFDGTTSTLKFIGKRYYQENASAAQVVINTGAAFNENKALWRLFINGIKYSHGLIGSEISTYDGNAGTITLTSALSAGDRIEFYGQSQ